MVYLISEFLQTLHDMVYAPIVYQQMLWILIPVLISIFLMDLYFKRYPREGMGHHRSLENSIFLIFIAFHLIYYNLVNGSSVLKQAVTYLLITGWVVVVVMDFLHRLPTDLIFRTSSKTFVGYSAYVGIVLVYSNMLQETSLEHLVSVILSIVILFGIIVLAKKAMTHFEPKSYEEIESFLERIEKDIEETSKKE